MGLFSSNKAIANNETNNLDLRVVADAGSIGLSGSNSTFNVLDGGVIAKAMDTMKMVNDSAGEGYSKLLDVTKSMFDKNTEQASAMAGTVEKNVLDAYRNAASDATGSIDNKTILAIVVVAGLAFVAWKMKT